MSEDSRGLWMAGMRLKSRKKVAEYGRAWAEAQSLGRRWDGKIGPGRVRQREEKGSETGEGFE